MKLPAELLRLSDEVVGRVRFLVERGSPEVWGDDEIVDSDTYSVVSILGWRGSGKTTVLKAACSALTEIGSEYLVLPVIRPELFTESQSVIASTIAGIRTVVARLDGARLSVNGAELVSSREVTILGDRLEFRGWVERLARYGAALGQPSDVSAEAGLDGYILDSNKTSGAAADFRAVWSEFVAALLHEVGSRRLVIPIDDADLASQGFMHVLKSIRWLANVDKVTVILAADQDEARRDLLSSQLKSRRLLPSETDLHRPKNSPQVAALRVVDGQLEKVMPTDGRVLVPEMAPLDCLLFVPLDADRTLYAWMSEFKLGPDYRGGSTLADLFGRVFDGKIEVTWLASALPTNPRELNALHRVLSRLASESAPRSLELSLVDFILEVAIQHGIRKSGLIDYWTTDFVERQSFSGGDLELQLNLDGLIARPVVREDSFYLNLADQPFLLERGVPGDENNNEEVSAAIKATLRTSGDTAISNRLRMTLPGPSIFRFEENVTDGEQRKSRGIDASLSSALTLAAELRGALPNSRFALNGNRPESRGGVNFIYYLECEGTDDRFLLTPRWLSSTDGWLFHRGWSSMMRAVRRLELSRNDRALAIILDAWRLILWIDSDQRVGDFQLTFMLSGTPSDDDAVRLVEELGSRYNYRLGAGVSDPNRFIEWYEELMVQSLHPWFLGPSTIETVWTAWWASMRSSARLGLALDGLGTLLESRIRRNLGSAWIEPLIEILARFDEVSANEMLRQHELRLQVQAQARTVSVGQAVVEAEAGHADRSEAPSFDDVLGFVRSLSTEGS